jgi:hypothetical protein
LAYDDRDHKHTHCHTDINFHGHFNGHADEDCDSDSDGHRNGHAHDHADRLSEPFGRLLPHGHRQPRLGSRRYQHRSDR